jgi:hypothetical protein
LPQSGLVWAACDVRLPGPLQLAARHDAELTIDGPPGFNVPLVVSSRKAAEEIAAEFERRARVDRAD